MLTTITSPAALPAAAPSTPTTPGSPTAPAGEPLELALLAASRRETARTATAAHTTSLVSDTAVAAAAQNTGLILGPSGDPIPSPIYVSKIFEQYVKPHSPAGTQPQAVFTPEGLYPITGVKSLPLDTSVKQGVEILGDTLQTALDPSGHVTVFGYSQSAIIASLLMGDIGKDPRINFVLVGNEMNPNGGFLARFPNLTMPSLGIPFYGATPNNASDVTNYTLEYDGFADFPRYPLNFLADLNAGMGIVFTHTQYANLTADRIADAIALPTLHPDTQHYYIIRTEDLPLLAPVRLLPVIGKPIADLLQPALKVIVNLGYGDPAYGWSNDGYADVQATFGLFPDVAPSVVAEALGKGIKEGIEAFLADIGPSGSVAQELSAMLQASHSYPGVTVPPIDDVLTSLQTVVTDTTNRITKAAASLYAALLPTADIINALVTTLPAYDVYLFLEGIKQVVSGDVINGLVNAIGLPIAANVGLSTTAGLIGALVWTRAIADAVGN